MILYRCSSNTLTGIFLGDLRRPVAGRILTILPVRRTWLFDCLRWGQWCAVCRQWVAYIFFEWICRRSRYHWIHETSRCVISSFSRRWTGLLGDKSRRLRIVEGIRCIVRRRLIDVGAVLLHACYAWEREFNDVSFSEANDELTVHRLRWSIEDIVQLIYTLCIGHPLLRRASYQKWWYRALIESHTHVESDSSRLWEYFYAVSSYLTAPTSLTLRGRQSTLIVTFSYYSLLPAVDIEASHVRPASPICRCECMATHRRSGSVRSVSTRKSTDHSACRQQLESPSGSPTEFRQSPTTLVSVSPARLQRSEWRCSLQLWTRE